MRIIFVPLFILNSVYFYAQSFNAIKVDFGIINNNAQIERERDGALSSFPENFESKNGILANGIVFLELDPKLRIGTGIGILQLKFDQEVTGIRTGGDIINGTVTSFSQTVSINNIGMPLHAQYDLFVRKFKFQGTIGTFYYKSFVTTSETKVTGDGVNDPVIASQTLDELSVPKGINVDGLIGINLSYPILERINLTAGALVQLILLKDGNCSNCDIGNIWAKGVSVGLEHSFN